MRITRQLLQEFRDDIRVSQQRTFPDVFDVCGRRFLILEGVFNPIFYDSTGFFAKLLPYPKGGGFFEVGVGSGAIAVTALLEGCAFSAGIDVNPNAISNSVLNAKLHGVEARLKVAVRDIRKLPDYGNSTLVFWAHPWVNCALSGKLGVLERSIMDPDYLGLEAFIRLAARARTARIFLGFGNTGDHDTLKRLCKKHKISIRMSHQGVSTMDQRYSYQLLELLS